ncbi:hypothetical protein ACPV5W_18485 [Vibrio astriarenae]
MKRTIYLHVGPHKTGTTLIQKICLDNQQELLKQGLFYPRNYLRIFGHHILRDKIKNRDLSQEDVVFFNSHKGNLLLSSEDFISLTPNDFKYFKQKLSGFEVKVIYSWRRSSLKMYSIWQEVIKHGSSVNFFEYYHQHLSRPGQSYLLSADKQVKRFIDIFGEDNVKIIDYDNSLSNKSLVVDFLSIMDCSLDEDKVTSSNSKVSENKSLTYMDVEIIKVLNSVFRIKYNVTGNSVREAYLRCLSDERIDVIDEVYNVLEEHKIEMNVGDYFIDRRNEDILSKQYIKNIVNYKKSEITKKVTLVSTDWIFRSKSQKMIGMIESEVRKELRL